MLWWGGQLWPLPSSFPPAFREARGKGGRGPQSSEAQAEVERPGSGPEAETTPDVGPKVTEQRKDCLVPAEQPASFHTMINTKAR